MQRALALGTLTAAAILGCRNPAPALADLIARCDDGAVPAELVLERALAIDGPADLEPSGLVSVDGKLFAVSDKHDDTLFELELAADRARAIPALRFEAPRGARLDLEGLARDADGAFLLASEGRYQILRVTPAGKAEPVCTSLEAFGESVGLFARFNAGIEGVVRLPDGGLLVAAEREPRGLIELPGPGVLDGARAWPMPGSRCPAGAARGNDFSDLAILAGDVYALARNAHLVVRLERAANRWLERGAWSYALTENDPRYAYRDRTFGIAEGLALDADRVFLVTDNNQQARAQDSADRRAQLFVFRRPGSDPARLRGE
jgi:uncharacterized protein YjiK